MLSQVIQRQVSIGQQVTFYLKDGRKVTGVLVEIGRDHVSLEHEGGFTTFVIDTVSSWEIVENDSKTQSELIEHQEKNNLQSDTEPSESDVISPISISDNVSVNPTLLEKVLEITARFKAHTQLQNLEIIHPNFDCPTDDFRGHKKTVAVTTWNRVKDKFTYAEKIKELSAKYGRIQPITNELKLLSEWFPASSSVKRHLAYLYWLAQRNQEALAIWKEIAIRSNQAIDWYNVAALALTLDSDALACYALERYFSHISTTSQQAAWYVYVRLLLKHSCFSTLFDLLNRSEDENVLFLETLIYILDVTGNRKIAIDLTNDWLKGEKLDVIISHSLKQLSDKPSEDYTTILSEFDNLKSKKESQKPATVNQPQGHIYKYIPNRNFGFLQDTSGQSYFFHRSAIIDDDLLEKLSNLGPTEQIPVVFDPTEGPKGPLATKVDLYRTLDQRFERAKRYAHDGEYPKAIAEIRKVLTIDSNYPNAQEYYEQWREYARVTGVPRGSNPYARAKRIQLIEKDLDRAIQMFREAIRRGDNVNSAVKDLASILAQLSRPEEAIEILKKYRNRLDGQSVDNMLIGFYQSAEMYDDAIELLEKKLKSASEADKRAPLFWQIANAYVRKEDYVQAEEYFSKVLKLQPDNSGAQLNKAICLYKQRLFDEAERILNRVLDTAPDTAAVELLEAINEAKTTGDSVQINDIIIQTLRADFSSEVSEFAQFLLDQCEFRGVDLARVQKKEFRRTDIHDLEKLATGLGTRKPRERADHYLAAASILFVLDEGDTSNQFYKYLCRSFASMGDACVVEGRPLDAAREFYCEALAIYDGDRSQHKGEQDAVNALVRFLYSTLGPSYMPMTPDIPSIDETVEDVLSRHPERDIVLDSVAYLILRSRFAASRVMRPLYAKISLRAIALDYLKKRGVTYSGKKMKDKDFARLWNELARLNLENKRQLRNEIQFFYKIDLTTASLEDSIQRIGVIQNRLFFDLDQDRTRQFEQILRVAREMCQQSSFEEQERLCNQIQDRCGELLREIEVNPTKFSIEELYSIIQELEQKASEWLDELYETSSPQLTLKLPIESYTPDDRRHIHLQISIANRMGCSPAESLELVVQCDEKMFSVTQADIKLNGSLRGGEREILRIPIEFTKHAAFSQTFSMPVYAQYRTRSNEVLTTSVENFSIRLYSDDEFTEISNPYATYAEGHIVDDPEMFYGRDELISNAVRAIQNAHNKSFVIYGQKRSGKSSILHHLKERLLRDDRLLILYLGDIGKLLDTHSDIPLLYQIYRSILRRLDFAIEDKVEEGFDPITISFPTDIEFYEHPSPLTLFTDTFENFRRQSRRLIKWRDIRLVLLIDEFTYIYGLIVNDQIPESFMKNWKAMLQEGFFSTVLVGQDYMPKFKERFPNEFGTIQDERVSYLRKEDAFKLIDEPIRITDGHDNESRYRERAIERIIDLSAGSPFYIQIICNRLVQYMNRKRARLVTDADVEQVKNELIRGPNALSADKFDNLINSGDTSKEAISDEDALKILTAIALNSQTGPCGKSNIICNTEVHIDIILNDLVNREILERIRGDYYRIRVGLFKEWLITHQK